MTAMRFFCCPLRLATSAQNTKQVTNRRRTVSLYAWGLPRISILVTRPSRLYIQYCGFGLSGQLSLLMGSARAAIDFSAKRVRAPAKSLQDRFGGSEERPMQDRAPWAACRRAKRSPAADFTLYMYSSLIDYSGECTSLLVV